MAVAPLVSDSAVLGRCRMKYGYDRSYKDKCKLTNSILAGPVLVTKEAIPDPQTLGIKAIYNGKVLQDASTRYKLQSPVPASRS
jgi:2-keto-4-pentenoate hydratase/2-oxohepta-3-ene-1,7-dioic acid hydratase in catechol pathway